MGSGRSWRRNPAGASDQERLPLGLRAIDVITTFEHELRHEVPVRSIAPGNSVPGLPEIMGGLLAALDTYDSPIDMSDSAGTYGVTPTPLADFVQGFVTANRKPDG